MADIPLTEKLLAEAGGWAAMKEARAIHAAGRVMEAAYVPPELRGRVRGGEVEYRAGLSIRSRTDIENTCTCPESHRRGLVCAHSLAVGLAVLKPLAAVAPPSLPVVPATVASPFSTTEGEPCALWVILPPNFAAAWEKGAIMVVVEAAFGSQRRPLATLNVAARYRTDEADVRLGEKFMALAGGRLAAMATLSRAEFAELLGVLAGHPRVSFGKATVATVEGQGTAPVLNVSRLADGAVRLECARDTHTLLAPTAAWRLEGATFSPVAAGLPAAYLRILEEAITVPASAAEGFMERELPMLARFFTIEGELAAQALEPVELPEPKFSATIEGSLNHLTASVEAIYGERRVTLDATGAALARFARNRSAEQSSLERLRACGFSGPDGKGELVLKGEARILAFFASALPRLQREWRVTVGERFQHVTREVERIEPRVEIHSSGEQWFDLSYELAATGGERFSGADIQRLLHAGQSHIRRKNGKLAVFDPGLLDEFENVLRESSPDQRQPGVYRLERMQAGALDAFAQDHGVAISGQPQWREWATATRQLERLRAVTLGALDGVLRPYQKQGVYWLHFLAQNGFGGILADEMGLGKTLQALAFIQTLSGQGPCLVVCPSSLIFNWQAEAGRWTPQLAVQVIEGAGRAEHFAQIAKANLVITSYPLLRRDVELYRGVEFAAVMLDEAQHIKNPDSQNAQAAAELKARHRFVLTGTPVENSVRDIWSLMHFLMPGYLGTRADFRERYENAIRSQSGGPEQQRLSRRIRPFLLRRTKQAVAGDLPEKLEQVAFCELGAAQREIYQSLASATRRELSELAGAADQKKSRMVMLTALLRLRQAACDVRLLPLDTPPEAADASAKLDLLSELLAEALDGGHRVLIFSQFVTMLGLMKERLVADGVEFCYLDGQTKDRGAEVARFQAGAAPVFLISLRAGGTGLNLTAADTVIHFDPWWNPAVEAQATDRAHRIGQKRVVTSYKLIARGTVEEKILTLQQRKRAVIAATLESEQPLMEGLSMAEIEDLLR